MQGPPSGPNDPAPHCSAHACTDVLPGGDVEPVPHEVHAPSPTSLLYVPDPQVVQTLPSGRVKPALHVQLDTVPLPAGDVEPSGQSTQASLDVAASDVEYVPARHATHDTDPAEDLYLPFVHDWQVSPSAPVNPALQLQSDNSSLAACDPAF